MHSPVSCNSYWNIRQTNNQTYLYFTVNIPQKELQNCKYKCIIYFTTFPFFNLQRLTWMNFVYVSNLIFFKKKEKVIVIWLAIATFNNISVVWQWPILAIYYNYNWSKFKAINMLETTDRLNHIYNWFKYRYTTPQARIELVILTGCIGWCKSSYSYNLIATITDPGNGCWLSEKTVNIR
jgi:hypothetical protein